MRIKTFCKPGSIYLEWDGEQAVSISRRVAGEMDTSPLAAGIVGSYEDRGARYGTPYIYIVKTATEEVESQPCWPVDYYSAYGVIPHVHYGSSPRPIMMGRIYNDASGSLLDPGKVISASYATHIYASNDVAEPWRNKIIDRGGLNHYEVVTSNLIVTPEWVVDDYGYNVRFTVPTALGYGYTYVVTLYLESTSQKMAFRWLVSPYLYV